MGEPRKVSFELVLNAGQSAFGGGGKGVLADAGRGQAKGVGSCAPGRLRSETEWLGAGGRGPGWSQQESEG